MNLVDQLRHTNDVASRLTDELNSLFMDHVNGKITESQFLMQKAKVCYAAEKATGMKVILDPKPGAIPGSVDLNISFIRHGEDKE